MCVVPLLLWVQLLQNPGTVLSAAKQARAEGKYEAAAALFDLLAATSPRDGALYEAQGDAHYLAGHLAHAIFAYRRAARVGGHADRLHHNLASLRGRVVDSPGNLGQEGMWLGSRPTHTGVALAGYVLGWTALLVWLSRRRRCWALGSCAMFVLALIVALPLLTPTDTPFAVVAVEQITLRRGNGVSYAPVEQGDRVVIVHQGAEARVHAARGNGWVQLEFANGVIGWAPREHLLLGKEDSLPLRD
jgi:hypothetical protein